jgi:hypothetical protein
VRERAHGLVIARKKIFHRMAEELRRRRAEKTSGGGMPGAVSDYAELWKRVRAELDARRKNKNRDEGECR